jgi:hypothetical protein
MNDENEEVNLSTTEKLITVINEQLNNNIELSKKINKELCEQGASINKSQKISNNIDNNTINNKIIVDKLKKKPCTIL